MVVQDGLDLNLSLQRPWLPVLCLAALQVERLLSSALVDWRRAQIAIVAVRLHALVRDSAESLQQDSQWRCLSSALTYFLLPPTHYWMLLWVYTPRILLQ